MGQPRRSLQVLIACLVSIPQVHDGSLCMFSSFALLVLLLPFVLFFFTFSCHLPQKTNMAAASNSAPLDPKLGRAADFVRPDFHQVNLDLENYLKTERNFKLDAGRLSTARYNFYTDIFCRPTNMSPVHHTSRMPPSAFTMSISSHYSLTIQFQATTSSPGPSSRARKETNGLQALSSKSL